MIFTTLLLLNMAKQILLAQIVALPVGLRLLPAVFNVFRGHF